MQQSDTENQVSIKNYTPPDWVKDRNLRNVPSHRLMLGNFPTPLHPWEFSLHGNRYRMLIKRDDLTDLTASGNKLRKLEFILPDIIGGETKIDWIISLGPLQSNSCRVVSAIAPKLGLRSAHVLVKNAPFKEDLPPIGNLFFHKLFGSEISIISREEYLEKGQTKLLEEAREMLITKYGAANPYVLPMGGSTLQGVFGYIECFQELHTQLEESGEFVDEIFFSCGSGGTAAGLAIGKFLTTSPVLKNVNLTGYLAWDSPPSYFHNYINDMLKQLGLDNEVKSEQLVEFIESKGLGYGINTEEELDVIRSVARSSGIVLDGTYTVKAVKSFIEDEGRCNSGKNCLFIHTGGMFSMMGHDHFP